MLSIRIARHTTALLSLQCKVLLGHGTSYSVQSHIFANRCSIIEVCPWHLSFWLCKRNYQKCAIYGQNSCFVICRQCHLALILFVCARKLGSCLYFVTSNYLVLIRHAYNHWGIFDSQAIACMSPFAFKKGYNLCSDIKAFNLSYSFRQND